MAWINYTYNSEMDNMRSGILHALEVLEAVRNATLTEDINANVRKHLLIQFDKIINVDDNDVENPKTNFTVSKNPDKKIETKINKEKEVKNNESSNTNINSIKDVKNDSKKDESKTLKENKDFNTIIINNINYNTINKTKTNEINNQPTSNKVKDVKKESTKEILKEVTNQKDIISSNKEIKDNKKVLNINLNAVNTNNVNTLLNQDKKMPISTKVEGNKNKIFNNVQIDFKSPKNNTLISSSLKDSTKNVVSGVSGIKKK